MSDPWSFANVASSSSSSHSSGGTSRALLVAGATAFALCLGALAWLCTSDSSPWSRGSQRRTRNKTALRDQPLLIELKSKRGRVQGMDWVKTTLKKDADGDEAHEFLGPF